MHKIQQVVAIIIDVALASERKCSYHVSLKVQVKVCDASFQYAELNMKTCIIFLYDHWGNSIARIRHLKFRVFAGYSINRAARQKPTQTFYATLPAFTKEHPTPAAFLHTN